MCGENAADAHGFSREDQDNYAIESYKRAQKAAKVRCAALNVACGCFTPF